MNNSDRLATLRILDANFNRASEGLRVIEEYVRFKRDDAYLSGQLKTLRHELRTVLGPLRVDAVAARDSGNDVGLQTTTLSEQTRGGLRDVVRASFGRVQEATRAIEEYGKLLSVDCAEAMKSIRAQVYILEQAILRSAGVKVSLENAQLYALVDAAGDVVSFERRIAQLVDLEVDVIQLREKRLDDRELLKRARLVRRHTESSPTLFIVNDRSDLAVLAEADGVHLGQEELLVHEARKIVGTEMLIGVSTHNIEQVRGAVLDGADYIGCGPTFPSQTKQFESFPGVAFLREVSAETSLPAFAVGGIQTSNLKDVLATGFRRVAMSGALAISDDLPATVAMIRAEVKAAANRQT